MGESPMNSVLSIVMFDYRRVITFRTKSKNPEEECDDSNTCYSPVFFVHRARLSKPVEESQCACASKGLVGNHWAHAPKSSREDRTLKNSHLVNPSCFS